MPKTEANWVTETIAYKGINKSYGTFFQNHIYSYHDAIVSIFYEKKNYNQMVYIVDETIIRYEQKNYHKRVIDRILVHVYGFFFIQV